MFHYFIIASSATGTSDYELQNRYCGGILSASTDAEVHGSVIGTFKCYCLSFDQM